MSVVVDSCVLTAGAKVIVIYVLLGMDALPIFHTRFDNLKLTIDSAKMVVPILLKPVVGW